MHLIRRTDKSKECSIDKLGRWELVNSTELYKWKKTF